MDEDWTDYQQREQIKYLLEKIQNSVRVITALLLVGIIILGVIAFILYSK